MITSKEQMIRESNLIDVLDQLLDLQHFNRGNQTADHAIEIAISAVEKHKNDLDREYRLQRSDYDDRAFYQERSALLAKHDQVIGKFAIAPNDEIAADLLQRADDLNLALADLAVAHKKYKSDLRRTCDLIIDSYR